MQSEEHRIVDINLETASTWGNAAYMPEGLILTDSIASASINKGPQRVNFILMALCKSGMARYTVDTHELQVRAGDLLFISDRHVLDRYQASADFDCQCIMVSTMFYNGFVQNVKNVSTLLLFSISNPVVHLTPMEIHAYGYYFKVIREKMANTEHPYRTELVKALLLAMFYDMSGVIYRLEQRESKKLMRSEVIFTKFIDLLEKNFRQERRVSWYAEQLCITPKYLSEIVKQASKRTPTEWIDTYVIMELRVLLKNSTKNIKEITKELNFPNQSFLGKYFKEHVGASPSEYRKL